MTSVRRRGAARGSALLAAVFTVPFGAALSSIAVAPAAHADVLDDIYQQYDTGSGGGQVSNLIHTAMRLRTQGFRPSKGNMADLTAAMDQRPNQTPLITALQNTVTFQKRNQARQAGQQPQAPINVGVTPLGPGQLPPLPGQGGINIPLG